MSVVLKLSHIDATMVCAALRATNAAAVSDKGTWLLFASLCGRDGDAEAYAPELLRVANYIETVGQAG